MHEIEYVKKDHEHHVRYFWDDLGGLEEGHIQGLLLVLDLDPPLPAVLFDCPELQLMVGGCRPGGRGWRFDTDEDVDGGIADIVLMYRGEDLSRWEHVRQVELKIEAPRSPGQFYAVKPGLDRETVIKGVLNQEGEPEEMECPECEAELYPIPEKCPVCGHVLERTMPTLGALVERYGPDARLEVHPGYADADIDVIFTRTEAQADEENRRARIRHDAKVELYEMQGAAWNRLVEPFKQKRRTDQEARERQELERLLVKYTEADA